MLDLKANLTETEFMPEFGYEDERGFIFSSTNSLESTCGIVINKKDKSSTNFGRQGLIGDIYMHHRPEENSEILAIFKLYLPLILAKFFVVTRPFIIVHMAQTLDGRICTCSGKSKWIGNEENLKHAHRLRALVDGVMVGGNTIANDLPRLNVRHVEGPNPVRLLLSNSFDDFDNLPCVEGMKSYLLRSKGNEMVCNSDVVSKTIFYKGDTVTEKLDDLLRCLRKEEIYSILLEGGPETVTSFYKENRIDWLQLHIAPLIFGSGKSFIQLSEIDDVSEGRKLDNVFYNKMGDGIMMTGELN